jgi:hypothetical protein
VTLLSKLHRIISRGDRVVDASEPVELVVVRGTAGPMTVARLREQGFDAAGYETNNGTGLASEYRILIPRSQHATASLLLDDIM